MFTAEVESGAFASAIAQTKQRINLGIVQAVTRAAEAGIAEAKRGRFRDRTGKLRREIHHTSITLSGSEVFTYLVSATPYARYVEYDTRSHWIRPKAGGGFIGPLRAGQSRRSSGDIGTHRVALRIPVGSGFIFRREVHHPGTTGTHYMRNGGLYASLVLREQLMTGLSGLSTIWS